MFPVDGLKIPHRAYNLQCSRYCCYVYIYTVGQKVAHCSTRHTDATVKD